jgi:plastocyanin
MSTGTPFLYKYYSGTGTANAYAGLQIMGCIRKDNFTVPMDAPGTLYYNCQFHGSMNGTITITN